MSGTSGNYAVPCAPPPGGNEAFAMSANLQLLGADAINTGPLALATETNSPVEVASLEVPGLGTTGIAVSVASEDSASSGVADVELDLAGVISVGAGAIEAGCNPPYSTLTGLTVSVGGVPITIPVNPEPNTEIGLGLLGVNIATLMLNEQVETDGSLVVTAARLTLLGGVAGAIGEGEVILAQATCEGE